MSGDATTTPLLATASDSPEHNEQSISSRRWAHSVAAFHQDFRLLLTSRTKHFIIMTTVALDVAILLANIFIQLIACQMHQDDELWVKKLVSGIEAVGLLFSCIFMVELIASLFSFGLRYSALFIKPNNSLILIIKQIFNLLVSLLRCHCYCLQLSNRCHYNWVD